MALNYAELFEDLGKLVKHYDLQKTDGTDLDTDLAEILAVYQDALPILGPQGTLISSFASWKAQHVGRRAALAGIASTRLQDKTTILDELGWPGGSIDELLYRLRLAMVAASESINASVVTIGAVSAAAGNHASDAVLMTTKVLDGYMSPGRVSGIQIGAQPDYAGVNSELAVPSDTVSVECVADSERDGRPEGSETFTVKGSKETEAHGVDPEGFGDQGTLQGLHSTSLVSNGDFESGAANIPSSWQINTGTAGTHIFLDGNAFHGAQSLKLLASGAPASISLIQSLPITQAKRNRLYCLSFWYLGEAGILAGDLSIYVQDGSGTIGSAVTLAPAVLSAATAWTHAYGFVLIPEYIRPTLNLHLIWATNPTSGKTVRVDDIVFGEVSYFGGIGLAWRRGAEFAKALRGDRWSFTVANSEGVFQRFFRRAFGVQMPSNNAGAETRADSLAT